MLAACCIYASTARGQVIGAGTFEVYPSSVYMGGSGLSVPSAAWVLHLGVESAIGYDSNLYMSHLSGGAGVFRLRGHLSLLSQPPQNGAQIQAQTVLYRVSGWVDYRRYFSTTSFVAQADQLNAATAAELLYKPSQAFALRLEEHLLYTTEPRNLEVADWGAFSPRIYQSNLIEGVWRPLQGVLILGIWDQFRVNHYTQPELANLRSIANDIDLYGQLKLFLDTTVRLDLRWQYIRYYDNQDGSMPVSVPIRVVAAIHSQLSSWLGASLWLGYGNSLTLGEPVWQSQALSQDRSPSFQSVIGGAEVRLHPLSSLNLLLGWSRDFFDSIYATYYKDDRFYFSYLHSPWRSLSLRAQLDLYLRGYGALYDPAQLQYGAQEVTSTQRDDFLITVAAELAYRPLRFLEIGASYSVLYDQTPTQYLDENGMPISASFVRHLVLFHLDLAY